MIREFYIEPDGDVIEDIVLQYEFEDGEIQLVFEDGGEEFLPEETELDWEETKALYGEKLTANKA